MARLTGEACPCHGTGEQIAGHTIDCWNLWLEAMAVLDRQTYG